MNLAIIPTRAGSKRIKDKNKKIFFGRPIIEYSLIACQHSQFIDDILVYTDDEDIHLIAQRWGVKSIDRSEATCKDDATLYEATIGAIEQYSYGHERPNLVMICYPCAPFVTPYRIMQGHDTLVNMQGIYDTVFPVIRNEFSIEYLLMLDKGAIRPMFRDEAQKNLPYAKRQTFRHAGHWWWCRVDALYTNGTIIKEGRIGYVELPWIEAQDIDVIEDWGIAEMKYRLWKGIA